MKPTVIVGAGLTGLSTGYALQRAGHEVLILERTDVVGGLARSLDLGGYVFDLGPHYFFLKFDPRADLLVSECLGDKAEVLDFQVSAWIRDRNLSWPPNLKDLFRLPATSTLTFLKNSIRQRFPKDLDCKGFISGFYGRAIYRDFIGPYIDKKVPMLGPEKLHRDWWLQVARNIHNQHRSSRHDEVKEIERRKRVPLAVRARVFFNLLKGIWLTAAGKQLNKVLYPYGGMGSLSRVLAERFKDAGGRIVFGANDVSLHRSGNRIRTVRWKDNVVDEPRTVIWTGAVHGLMKELGMPAPDLPFVRIALGFIKVRRTLELPRYLYTYYSQPEIIFNRAYFPRLITGGLVPPGKDAICVEISPPDSDNDTPLDDDQLKEKIIMGMEKLSLCCREEIEEITLLDIPNAYPVYPLDYYETLDRIWEELRPIENLWSIGRSGQFHYNNMARTVAMGLDLAEHLTKGEHSSG